MAVPAGWVQVCRRCGRGWPLSDPRWVCDCRGLLDLLGPSIDPIGASSPWSLWRYRSALPAGSAWKTVTLGEGMTPLVALQPGVWGKLEYVSPTRSFKDRGAAVMMSGAADVGVRRAVVDSSGNAGTAVAAYGARCGVVVEVYVPSGTPTAKMHAAEAFGARVAVVAGDRTATAAAARERAAASGSWYASHVYRPTFVHGVKTLAFELWEQLGGSPPGTVVVPAGNGTLVQGLWLGFRELAAHGHISRPVAIVAVQADRCAPLAGLRPNGSTAASGIAIPHPPRLGAVSAAVRVSGGRVLTVAEEDLEPARADLARMGIGVEATAAAAWAAWPQVAGLAGPVVVVLTGSG